MVTTGVEPVRAAARYDVRRLRGVLGITGAALIFTVLTLAVRLRWGPLLAADVDVAGWLNGVVAPRPTLVRILTTITTFGSTGVLVWLVALPTILLLTRRRFRLAAYLVVTATGAFILDPTVKALVGRLRPVVEHPIAVGGGSSFPSGHSLDSFVCYGALLLVFLPAVARRRRWLPIAVGALVVVLIGLTRIALGVHFVSDVVGAWSIGTVWLGLTVYAFEIHRRHLGDRVPQPLVEGLEPEAAADVAPTGPTPSARGTGPRDAAWLVIGWVLVAGALVGLGVLLQRAGGNLLGDETLPRWLAAHRTPGLNAASDFWSQAGNTHAIMAVGLVVGAVALGLSRRWRPVVFLVTLMMGELSLFLVTARIIGRDRPEVDHLDGPLPTSAYPSGHVAATLCLYAGIALLVLPRTRAWWRWLFVGLATVMAALVAMSRLYRGMHHPTDVLASVILAAGWVSVVYLVVRPHAGAETEPHRRPSLSTVGAEPERSTAARGGPVTLPGSSPGVRPSVR